MKKILIMPVTGDEYRNSEYALLELDKDTVKDLLKSSKKAQDFAKREKNLASIRLFDNTLRFVSGRVEELFDFDMDMLEQTQKQNPLIVETGVDLSSFPADAGIHTIRTEEIYRVVYADGDICWETHEKHADGLAETALLFKDFLNKLAKEFGLA